MQNIDIIDQYDVTKSLKRWCLVQKKPILMLIWKCIKETTACPFSNAGQ